MKSAVCAVWSAASCAAKNPMKSMVCGMCGMPCTFPHMCGRAQAQAQARPPAQARPYPAHTAPKH